MKTAPWGDGLGEVSQCWSLFWKEGYRTKRNEAWAVIDLREGELQL